jgi:hypothetical protein
MDSVVLTTVPLALLAVALCASFRAGATSFTD